MQNSMHFDRPLALLSRHSLALREARSEQLISFIAETCAAQLLLLESKRLFLGPFRLPCKGYQI